MAVNSSTNIRLILIICLLLAGLTFDTLSGLGVFYRITLPIGKLFAGTVRFSRNFLDELSSVGSLNDQLEAVILQNDQLANMVVDYERLKRENEQLKEQLIFRDNSGYKMVSTRVISYQSDSVRSTMRISAGNDEGIRADLPVLAGNNLIGKVIRVERKYADVLLLHDADFRVLASNQSQMLNAIIKGQVGGGISLERIPRTDKLAIGDIIVTSGKDSEFPKGLVIGMVASVQSDVNEIFMTAHVKAATNPYELDVVSVLLP